MIRNLMIIEKKYLSHFNWSISTMLNVLKNLAHLFFSNPHENCVSNVSPLIPTTASEKLRLTVFKVRKSVAA